MLLIWCFCVFTIIRAQNNPRVKTSQGWVVGRKAVYGDYLVFYGIPYAGPTSGPNRFKPPTPAPKHTKDFQAIDSSITCARTPPKGMIRVEDCLTLSIHTRNLTTAKPVFVWLEGDQFKMYETPLYSYKSLVMEDLIVVSINYRRSIFGFLCLQIPEAPGNAGLKDVVQGLKWVRDNIAGFGGDPNNVMLVGHEFGAVMVDLITLSPMAKNLVHKAVALSGSALSPWAVAYEPIQYAEAFTAKVLQGITGSKVADMLSLFNFDVLNRFTNESSFYNASLLFAPCIEYDNNPDLPFLSKSPTEILRSGDYKHIPYIAGYTQREGSILMYEAEHLKWTEKMEKQFSDFLPLDLGFYSIENKKAISVNVRDQYFATEKISMKNLDKYFDYHGDVLITIPVLRAAQERAKTSKETVRLFEFAYNGTMNSDWRYKTPPITGARHGALPKYLFGYDLKPHDVDASNSIIDLFTGFAYSGKPFRSPNKSETWLPVTEESLNKLYISGGETADNITEYSEQVVEENGTSILFWEIVLQNYYKAPAAPTERTTSAASSLRVFTVRPMFCAIVVPFVIFISCYIFVIFISC